MPIPICVARKRPPHYAHSPATVPLERACFYVPRLDFPTARLLNGWLRFALAAVLTAFTTTIWADTIWLKNGDRLSGTIKSLDGGQLLMHTEYGGDLRIKFDQVATLQSEGELAINGQSLRRNYLAKLVRAESGQVTLVGTRRDADGVQTPVDDSVPLNEVERVVKPRPLIRDTMVSGTLDLGLNRKSASNKSQDYNAALRGEARHGLWRHQLGANYAREKENNNINTNAYGVTYSLDGFLTEKAFWQGRLSHERDFIEELDRQTGYGTGPGYQFWDNDLGAFSLTGLLGRLHYGYSDGSSDSFYAASLRWDYTRYFRAKQIEIFARGEFARPLNNAADFSLNAELGGRYNINDWASLYLKLSRNQISGSRESLNENLVSTGLGIKW